MYARPSNSGPGRTFMMGLPYILETTGARALMLIVVRPTGHTVRVAGEPLAESLVEGTKP